MCEKCGYWDASDVGVGPAALGVTCPCQLKPREIEVKEMQQKEVG